MGHLSEGGRRSCGYPRVLLGDGRGSFTATLDQNAGAVSATATDVATGDFNGDGKLDLVALGAAYGSSQLNLLLGNGDGSFQPPTPLTSGSLSIGDFNHDGRADMVSATVVNGAPSVTVSLGQANGSFSDQVTTPSGFSDGPLTLLDLNKDGKPDLFVAGLSNMQTLLGNGDGTFSSLATVTSVGGPYYPAALHAADLDGDGYPDVIAETYAGAQIFYGTPGGGFLPPVLVQAGTRIRIADMDLDGKLDLVGVLQPTFGAAYIQVLHNLGNRTFGNPDLYVGGTSPGNLEVVDVNGDGYPDIAVANTNTDTVTVLLNQGTAGATTATLAISPQPSQYMQPITLSATFAGKASSRVPTGTMACDLGGTPVGMAALSNGTATVVGTPNSPAGTYLATCRYTGDATYSPSSVSAPHTVTYIRSPVTLSLSASPTSVLTSQTVRLVATETSSTAVGYGRVTFSDGAVGLGSGFLDNNGVAQLDTNLLAAGTHSIVAKYPGYDDSYKEISYLPATSNPVTVTVSAHATSNTLSLSSPSSAAGAPLTMTSTVTTSDGSAPFGSVTFLDGGTALGTSLLAGGKAVWSTSFAAPGTHTLTAAFHSNETFAGSTSSTANYTANSVTGGSPSAVGLSFAGSPTAGTAQTLTAIVASTPNHAPSGHVVAFFDGGLYLGSATTGQDAAATLSLDPGSALTRNFLAFVQSDQAVMAVQSAPLPQTDSATGSFTLSLPRQALMPAPYGHTSLPITLVRHDGSSDSIALSCMSTNGLIACSIASSDGSPVLVLTQAPAKPWMSSAPGKGLAALLFGVCMFSRKRKPLTWRPAAYVLRRCDHHRDSSPRMKGLGSAFRT